MTEKVVGTLRQFIEIDESFILPSSLASKVYPFHKNDHSCRKRVRTSIDEYVAHKKKMYKKSLLTNSYAEEKPKKLEQFKTQQRTRFEKQVERRQKKSIHNISIFKKDAYFATHRITTRPKLEESMLRALQKIRYVEQDQNITKSKHEISYDNRPQFNGIKLAPFMFDSSKSKRQYIFANRKSTERKKDGKISPQKRIQYEQCLNWAKKHHKDSHYYALQLGKLKQTESLDEKSERRRSLLKKLKDGKTIKVKRQRSLK